MTSNDDYTSSSSVTTAVVLGLLGGLLCLCLTIGGVVGLVVVCRRKAKRTRSNTLTAGVIDFPTQDMIDTVPTATESGYELELLSPVVQAQLTLPPARTEGMESIPVAVVQVV